MKSESCPTCNDVLDNVTTLNVPAISAYYQSRNAPFYTTWSLSGLVWGLGYKPWVTQTVHDLLWGYDEPLFTVAQTFLNDPPPFDRFGLFLLKNSSKEEDLGMYSMYTGEGNPYTLSNIQSFNGKESSTSGTRLIATVYMDQTVPLSIHILRRETHSGFSTTSYAEPCQWFMIAQLPKKAFLD